MLVNFPDVYNIFLWTTYGNKMEIFAATSVQQNSQCPRTGKSVKPNKWMLWQILKISTIQPRYTMLFALVHSFVINLKQYITQHLPK